MKLVLISGPPRSGTTWLNRELSMGKHTSGFLPECTILTQQVALYERTLNYCDPLRFSRYFGTQKSMTTYYRDNLSRLLDQIKSLNTAASTRSLILKDPELTHYLSAIVDLMPKHDLVLLVRDPRDVVASVKTVRQRQHAVWEIQKSVEWIYSYYHAIALHLERQDKNLHFVRYEDLVSDHHVLQRLMQKLDIGRTLPIGGAIMTDNTQFNLDHTDPFHSDLYLEPTTKSRIGSFATILNKEEIALVEKVFSGVMITWDYPPSPNSLG
jgi:hypothetical protein